MNNYEVEHYKLDIDIKNSNESRSIIYSLIDPNTTVLDLGCACGDLGVILQNKNCSVYGLEYVQECVNIAQKTNAYAEVEQCDLDYFDIEKFQNYQNLFDYIVLGDVLEHLYNSESLLIKIFKVTRQKSNNKIKIDSPKNVIKNATNYNLLKKVKKSNFLKMFKV